MEEQEDNCESMVGTRRGRALLHGQVERDFEVSPDLLEQAKSGKVQVFRGEWDAEGVYFYQAYRQEIASWALEHGHFGGPHWNPTRMTWIKPSFAWMLYRAGYGRKPGQEHVLRVKISHAAVAQILSHCNLTLHEPGGEGGTSSSSRRSTKTGKPSMVDDASTEGAGCGSTVVRSMPSGAADPAAAPAVRRQGDDGGSGRVQWDPERDLFSGGGREPRKMPRTRAIQIGMSGSVSQFYVDSALSIEEVTELAHLVQDAHSAKTPSVMTEKMEDLRQRLPRERPYMPQCSHADLTRLGLLPGEQADALSRLGRGRAA